VVVGRPGHDGKVLYGGEIAEGVGVGTAAGLVLEGMLISCGVTEPEDRAAKLLELSKLSVPAGTVQSPGQSRFHVLRSFSDMRILEIRK
jgi:hypothetical protein